MFQYIIYCYFLRQEKEKEELIKSILEHKAQEEQKEMKQLEESYKILRETQVKPIFIIKSSGS